MKLLKEKISAVEAQMRARLGEIQHTFEHSGDKGSSVENVFKEFLREYLPRRLEIGSGEVVDSKGHRSNQTDIVIVSEDHPLTFRRDSAGIFFIEGISAVGEVKTTLTGEELEKTMDNSFRFKQLEMDPGKNTQVLSNPSDLKRYCEHPPYFLVSFASQLKLVTLVQKIWDFLVQKGHGVNDINTVLDAIFVLDRGWVINFGDGQGGFQFITPEGAPAKGWIARDSGTVLFEYLGWLSAVMPKMIRFEPILPLYMFPKSA